MLLAGIPAFAAGLLEDITKKMGVLPRLLATMASGVLAWYLSGVAMQNTGVTLFDMVLGFMPVAVLFTAFAVAVKDAGDKRAHTERAVGITNDGVHNEAVVLIDLGSPRQSGCHAWQ